MEQLRQSADEHRMEQIIGNLLRTGVLLAALVALAGAALFLYRHGTEVPDYHFFQGEPKDLRTADGILHNAMQIRGRGIILAGMLILIATPVFRVVFAMLAFLWLHDRLYSLISLIVLAALLFSLFGMSL